MSYVPPLPLLDEFAISIGLQRHYRHDAPGFPHYDLNASRREVAIKAGAIELNRDHPIMKEIFLRRRRELAGE